MGLVNHVLDADVVSSLAEHEAAGGGRALEAARAIEPEALIEVIEASGLRGRGGAGFPTGTKWRTVAGLGEGRRATVVVNGAEGEPGTLKDRTLLRRNPYKVLEGALIAAHAVGADEVVVGVKSTARGVVDQLTTAFDELRYAGWTDGVEARCVVGGDRYLLGEETALLEVLDGKPPFPRVAPPYRAGAEPAAPTLVNNVETMANVPAIVIDGPAEFRSRGTKESPGTIVCTVSGRTERAGVGEVELGSRLGDVIEALGGGPTDRVVAVLAGTAHPILPAAALDAPLTWEGMAAAGGGLGSAGFIVIDDRVDLVAVAHGVSRFLSVESCGQCTPCKQDGLAITGVLDRLRSSAPEPDDLEVLPVLAGRVTDGARCYLAQQHQSIVQSLLTHFPDALAAHADGRASAAGSFPIVPLLDIVDGEAVLDLDELEVPADWVDGETTSPSDRIDVRAT
ncbi:MAG: NADH-ubiquinone oxidoreductase-F iron-sulfur binding region domain-containing protein [Acidimicrobiales bacterium]